MLELLAEAWRRRLTFTIGTSVTTGESNTVVWNEIHHKTSISNERGHGYPDPNYLDNVVAELAAQGVEDNWHTLRSWQAQDAKGPGLVGKILGEIYRKTGRVETLFILFLETVVLCLV